MRYSLLLLPLLFLGCSYEPKYNKLSQEFDCRDGDLYMTTWRGLNVTIETNISTNEYLFDANTLVISNDDSRILCIEE